MVWSLTVNTLIKWLPVVSTLQVPELPKLLDQAVFHGILNRRRATQVMWRSSKKNEDKAVILIHNSPLPCLNRCTGNDGLGHLLPANSEEVITAFTDALNCLITTPNSAAVTPNSRGELRLFFFLPFFPFFFFFSQSSSEQTRGARCLIYLFIKTRFYPRLCLLRFHRNVSMKGATQKTPFFIYKSYQLERFFVYFGTQLLMGARNNPKFAYWHYAQATLEIFWGYSTESWKKRKFIRNSRIYNNLTEIFKIEQHFVLTFILICLFGG